jgi:hypothetical protein
MTQRNRILKTLSVILPAGAFGASVLLALGSSDAKAATNAPTAVQTRRRKRIDPTARNQRRNIKFVRLGKRPNGRRCESGSRLVGQWRLGSLALGLG